jgi:type IV pilus biogenesis protein CpaD/CtpE
MSRTPIMLLASAVAAVLLLTGCSVNPTYTVRVINDSRTNLNARIEHERKFDTSIMLESLTVQAGEERTLGPVESPPMERVVLTIAGTGSSISAPERFVIRRGSYTARISTGSSTSWAPYEVNLTKD